jgi:hypothetical protein
VADVAGVVVVAGVVGVSAFASGACPNAAASLATNSGLLPLASKPLLVSSWRNSGTLSLLRSAGVAVEALM